MNPVSAVVIFIIIWWMVLFMVLPFGIRREDQPEEGNDPGAPVRPRLWLKVAVTTGISVVVFAVVFWAIETEVISLFGPRVRPA